jgi:hypothetical protein
LFLLFGKVHIFENFLQFYQYLVIDDGNTSDCNSFVKSIRKTSKFYIYFIYIKRHFNKKIYFEVVSSRIFFKSTHCPKTALRNVHKSFWKCMELNISTTTKKTNRFTAYYQIFLIKTFHLYQVVSFAKLITVVIKKICMSWEYFLGDRN